LKKNYRDYCLALIGLALLVAGLIIVKANILPQGFLRALPYVCIGIGCGVFGHGTGNIIGRRAVKTSRQLQKQIQIDTNDERNVAISNKAKAKAYDMMIFVFGSLMFSLALMGVDLTALLLLVFAYLFVAFYGAYFRNKYDKEM
jgi:hypothetical protein